MNETEKKVAPQLATVKLDIDPGTLKRVAETGRLAEFVETFPVLLAGQVKAQLVEQLAKGEYNVSMSGAFTYSEPDDNRYGNGIPPRPHPHWSELGQATQLRVAAQQFAAKTGMK